MKFFPLLVRLRAVIYVLFRLILISDINRREKKKHLLLKISQKVETKTNGEVKIIEDKHKETKTHMYYLHY